MSKSISIESKEIPPEIVIMESKEVLEQNRTIKTVTLLRYSNNINENRVNYTSNERIFTPKHEVQLVRYCQHAVRLNYGFSAKEFRKFSFEYAVANNINCPQKWHENKLAGTDWLKDFLDRNKKTTIHDKDLQLPLEMNYNQTNLERFYGYLSKLLDENSFEPQNIYNIDQTKIGFNKKFNMRPDQNASNDKTVNMCVAVNAIGKMIPPMFTVPNKKLKDESVSTKSGWLQETEFLEFIKHFAKYAKAGPDNKVLLMLDNQNSQIKLPVIDFCKMNFITMLSFPPNTSEKLQPLDRSVFGPFKNFYEKACDDWVIENPGKKINILDMQNIAELALPQAATPNNIIEGFSCTGLHPFNANMFVKKKMLDENEPMDLINVYNEDQIDIMNFEPLDSEIANNYHSGGGNICQSVEGLRRSKRVGSKFDTTVIGQEFLEKYFKGKEKQKKKRKMNLQTNLKRKKIKN